MSVCHVKLNSLRQELGGFEDQKLFKNITGPTSRGIDVKVYDKCLMCSGFEPRDGGQRKWESEKVHFEQLFSLHSPPRRNSPPVFSVFLPLASLSGRGPESLSPHIRKLTDPFSLTLPSTTTMTGRTRRKEGDKMSERGREKESEISLQALVSSRPLALPHWDFVYRRT